MFQVVLAADPHDNHSERELPIRSKIQMEIKISNTLDNRSGMLLLKLLLANAQLPVQVDLKGHRVTRVGRVRDVFEDLAVWEGGDILWKQAVVLGLEQEISSSSLGGIAEDMNSQYLTAFPNGFLVVKLEDLAGERDGKLSKFGKRFKELSIMGQVKLAVGAQQPATDDCRGGLDGINDESDIPRVKLGGSRGEHGRGRNLMSNEEPDPGPLACS